MIQVIILDTDNKMMIFSRSDGQAYNKTAKYLEELKQSALNKDIKYINASFAELKDLFSDL